MRRLPELPTRVKGDIADYRIVRDTQDQTNAGEHIISPKLGCEIRITSVLPLTHQWQTFFHEILHKWEQEAGVKSIKDEPEDSDVDRLARAMLADFLRNGWKLPGEE